MVVVTTNLTTRESARKLRFEPTGNVTATDTQKAIQQVDAEAAGKVAQVGTARLPAAAATVNILASDIEVGINTGTAATACPLPSVAAWAAANPNGLELTLFDATGNAAAHAVTPSLNGTDVFTQGVTPVIGAAYGQIKLRPVIVAGGPNQWFVRGVD